MSDLEYQSLLLQIAGRCHSPLGKDLALAVHPLREISAITKSQALIGNFQAALSHGLELSFEDLCDLQPILDQQGIFDWEEFRLIALNAELAVVAASKLEAFKDFHLAKSRVQRLQAMPDIMLGFMRIFDPEGEVQDSASAELLQIRRKIASIRGRIQKTMQNMLSEPRLDGYLQDRFITQRDDRYVLPVKESAAPFVNGIVQSRSGSKSTVFIEPAEVVPMNNELQLAKQDEKREIFRILSDFSKSITSRKEMILRNQKNMAELDYLSACARFANAIRAKVPRMQEQPIIRLQTARHPLLILRMISESGPNAYHKVIPFDLSLGKDFNMLILSGPNTGGKTVLMKAVGLITLMALSGLPIPADEDSQIGMFSEVFADIGDDQSIENALSTFSSHLDKIRRMLDAADAESLILIDEIGAATDPQQGSALAQAILEKLAESGAKGIVTTHYTALKVFAESHPGCINASMQFDLKSLIPTYKFSAGIPGDSFAIEVAASLGMNPQLIQRAKSLAGSQNLEFTSLLKKLQEEKKNLAKQSYEFELKTRNLEARIHESESREQEWQKELKSRRQRHLQELQGELISFQKLYTREISEIKTLDREERKRISERKLHDISVKTEELSKELIQTTADGLQPLTNPQKGDRVWLANFDAEAIILEIQGQSAKVDMNGISFKTEVDNLFAPKNMEQVQAKPLSRVHSQIKVQRELKLLGLTFDEAMPLIDEFLDNAAMAGIGTLRIVHGKGTGALRSKVRDYLSRKKTVKRIDTPPLFEGGSGVTVVTI
ncbi:MAG: endonuclease MutS2 [Candidatus Cloacimonetes bacterium]|nr:endonuclease MutS2 [Candidatus Cloacimonadota bacterium]